VIRIGSNSFVVSGPSVAVLAEYLPGPAMSADEIAALAECYSRMRRQYGAFVKAWRRQLLAAICKAAAIQAALIAWGARVTPATEATPAPVPVGRGPPARCTAYLSRTPEKQGTQQPELLGASDAFIPPTSSSFSIQLDDPMKGSLSGAGAS
jgi:hypothetical protein